jgi:CysZ protein
MNTTVLSGPAALIQGFSLIRRPELRRYVLIPMLINIVLFAFISWLALSQVAELVAWLLPSWLAWLSWLLIPVLYVATLLIAFVAVMLLANIVAAPFNAILSLRVEQLLTGQAIKSGSLGQTLRATPALIASELRKILYFLLRAIPLLSLFIIPGINVIAPFTWFLFGAWFMSIEYMDYPMGNHGIGFAAQRDHLRQHRLQSLGFGGLTLALTMIPLLNFVVIPTAVAGATVLWVGSGSNHTDRSEGAE